MAKLALLPLTADLFVQFAQACKDGPPRRFQVKENPLPDDVEIVSIGVSATMPPVTLALLLKSESFADIPDGEQVPEVPRILFETVYDEVSATVA